MDEQRIVVHMIGNAHIDPVWLWRVDEGRAEVLSTYRSAIERMAETPAFVFTSGGAVTYRWVQEDDPELFAAIRERVAEGRWVLVNGWWIQPDCNIPSGESFVRHGLYGQRALDDMFGRHAVTGYNVDSFGHAGSLPQILRGCGLYNYVFFRPQPGREKELPGTLFWWESDDGSQVLTSRPPLHYPSHPGDLSERIDSAARQAPPDVGHVMCFYGVGNHGGGPTRANIASILEAMERTDGPQVLFDGPDHFFDIVRRSKADLPVVHDELQHHSRGCYTAVSRIKWYNRKCEQSLLTAEKFAALAWRLVGAEYPRAALNRAWEDVLFNQFHDILAGTSIREACEDVYRTLESALRSARHAMDEALDALSERIDVSGEGRPLLVFNPHPWPQKSPVEAVVPTTERWNEDRYGEFRPGALTLIDERGNEVTAQVTEIEHDGGYYLLHFCFMADLPALGYRCYHYRFRDAPEWMPPEPRAATILENERLRLTFDPQSGWLSSLYDKQHGIEYLRDAGGVLLVIDDPSDTWSHDVDSFREVIGRFHAGGEVTLVEEGPVRWTVRVSSKWGNSTAVQEYTLYAGDDQVYLRLTVDWHERHKMLKLAFPLAIESPQSTASIPYGCIRRVDDGGEEPCQSWVDVSGRAGGRECGLALLNDCKYGYDVLDGELRMSILRSPVYAFHMPRKIMPGIVYHYTDQGKQVVNLALVPHVGGWDDGDVIRRAWSLNAPPIARRVKAHAGNWPPSASWLSCTAPNVVLTVLKRAEDGGDLIVRGYETFGRATTAEVRFLDERWLFAWRPYEIKTLRLHVGEEPREVNMLEQSQDNLRE